MTQPVGDIRVFSISIRSAVEPEVEFDYSAPTTISDLNRWIYFYMGIPVKLQQLNIVVGSSRRTLQANPADFLKRYLSGASRIELFWLLKPRTII